MDKLTTMKGIYERLLELVKMAEEGRLVEVEWGCAEVKAAVEDGDFSVLDMLKWTPKIVGLFNQLSRSLPA